MLPGRALGFMCLVSNQAPTVLTSPVRAQLLCRTAVQTQSCANPFRIDVRFACLMYGTNSPVFKAHKGESRIGPGCGLWFFTSAGLVMFSGMPLGFPASYSVL